MNKEPLPKEIIELAVMAQLIYDKYGWDAVEIIRQIADEHERELKELLSSHEIIATLHEER